MKSLKIMVATAALGLVAGASTAATVQDVELKASGEWTDTTAGDVYGLNGEGTNEMRWGLPSTLSGVTNRDAQSGYGFEGALAGTIVEPGVEFAVGTFTHYNNRIMAGTDPYAPTISGAELRVDTSIMIGATSYLFTKVFDFLHDETKNSGESGGGCLYGGTPGDAANGGYGCNDRVTAVVNEDASSALVVDGVKYTFEFSGFRYNGGLFSFFDTVEEQTNIATLVGRFKAETLAPVPLPAAGWLLLAGVGGLAAVKRRRSRSTA